MEAASSGLSGAVNDSGTRILIAKKNHSNIAGHRRVYHHELFRLRLVPLCGRMIALIQSRYNGPNKLSRTHNPVPIGWGSLWDAGVVLG